jgi:Acetyltransferase (GNAT) family
MIRKIALRDYSDILFIKTTLLLDTSKINEPSYRVKTEQSGFFLYKKSQTKKEFAKDLLKIHFVYEENGEVKGYVRIDEEQEMDKGIEAFWFEPELKELYFTFPHAAVGGIGLFPEVSGKGVALQLLKVAEEEVKKKKIPYLFSFVALSPMDQYRITAVSRKKWF